MKDRNYRIHIYQDVNSDGSKEWTAEYPDIFGLVGIGETYIEAIAEAELAKKQYLDFLDEANEKYPTKNEISELSGRLTFRTSKTTHKKMIDRSELEGVSLNQLINEAVINYLSDKNHNDSVTELKKELLEGISLLRYEEQPYIQDDSGKYKMNLSEGAGFICKTY